MKSSRLSCIAAITSTDGHEDDRRAALVAYLSSGYQGRLPLSQSAIAALGMRGLTSQSAVSRALQHALTRGYLTVATPILELRALKRDRVSRYVEQLVELIDLQERLKVVAEREGWERIPKVHSIPVCLDSKETVEKSHRLMQTFFEFAGLATHELLHDCRKIGVSCGQTMGNLVSALEEFVAENSAKLLRLQTVTPLVGESPINMTSEFSSTLLAERLRKRLSQYPEVVQCLTLRHVHSFISDDLARYHCNTDLSRGRQRAFEYYRAVSSHKRIFGGSEDDGVAPLVPSLDAVITSLSCDEAPWGIRTQEAEEGGDLFAEIRSHSIGDICGVLLPSDGASIEPLREFQERWTGMRPAQLLLLAKRAEQYYQPGVIVVAFGAEKVRTTLAALRGGYINHLVVDEGLAQALVNALPVVESSRIPPGSETGEL